MHLATSLRLLSCCGQRCSAAAPDPTSDCRYARSLGSQRPISCIIPCQRERHILLGVFDHLGDRARRARVALLARRAAKRNDRRHRRPGRSLARGWAILAGAMTSASDRQLGRRSDWLAAPGARVTLIMAILLFTDPAGHGRLQRNSHQNPRSIPVVVLPRLSAGDEGMLAAYFDDSSWTGRETLTCLSAGDSEADRCHRLPILNGTNGSKFAPINS
jgi:hypothetical protein